MQLLIHPIDHSGLFSPLVIWYLAYLYDFLVGFDFGRTPSLPISLLNPCQELVFIHLLSYDPFYAILMLARSTTLVSQFLEYTLVLEMLQP